MKKVLIIGNAGSGKTTFAKALAVKTGLPLIHLDRLFWRGKWEHLSNKEFDPLLQKELEKTEWIIDGNFDRTIPMRLSYCDTVFYFDLPPLTCLWGLTARVIKNYGKTREDMGGNCPEHFDRQKFGLYKAVIGFNKKHRKKYHRLLAAEKNKDIIVFKSRRDVKKYLKSFSQRDEVQK